MGKLARKSDRHTGSVKRSRGFEEKFKKLLTSLSFGDIIDRLSHESGEGTDWNLTIEQQIKEVQSKKQVRNKICQNQREHNSKKVKKAKINSSNESNRE